MNNAEKVAVLTALHKRVRQELDAAREELDQEMLASYDENGTLNKELRVCNEKVGKISLRLSKPSFAVTDYESLLEFAKDYGFARATLEIRPEYKNSALAFLSVEFPESIEESWGLIPEWEQLMTATRSGVMYSDSTMQVPGVEAVAPYVIGSTVTGCKFDDVSEIVRSIPNGIMGYLNGGDE